ncbi:MAG: DUF480 domain-containing protein [Acidimicrobiales bacterium]
MLQLSPNACRVLGSLLEKEVTVPATYPMTLNALLSACNQSSGRDPVMHLGEAEATAAIDELRQAGFARLVHASHGARSVKYRQVATDALVLDPLRRAVLTVLLLRGPQTPGELRSRGERLHAFTTVDEVDRTLDHLAGLDEPLVAQLPRRAGQKEQRWAHLLGGRPVADEGPAPAAPAPREPAEVPVEVAALAAFVGTWTGTGTGHYPTIDDFGYTEQIELRPVPGKPILAYRSSTRARDDGRTLHGESGFVRLVGDGLVEVVLAHGSGIVEVAEGLIDGDELALSSTDVVGTGTAKEVTEVDRRYRVVGDTLTYELAMAAVGQPLQNHLHATLTRS